MLTDPGVEPVGDPGFIRWGRRYQWDHSGGYGPVAVRYEEADGIRSVEQRGNYQSQPLVRAIDDHPSGCRCELGGAPRWGPDAWRWYPRENGRHERSAP